VAVIVTAMKNNILHDKIYNSISDTITQALRNINTATTK